MTQGDTSGPEGIGSERELFRGVRIIDFTRAFAGPLATMMLADLGADVIKVENPKNPDETRTWPPVVGGKLSSYFSTLNRNKRSIAVDLSVEEGREVAHGLMRSATVVVENFTPGVAEKLGIGYEVARELNPSVVYCSISGFGRSGPYRHRKGYDPVLQAMGGLMGVTGEKGGAPVKTMIPVADFVTGLFACSAIMAALYRQRDQGVGGHIDMSMLDSMVALTSTVGMAYLHSGIVPPRSGTENPTRVPSAAFECQGGELIQLVPNQRQWSVFCEIVGYPELATDPRFRDNIARIRHQDVLYPILRGAFRRRPARYWLERFEAAGIPAGPIYSLDALFRDPQVIARSLVNTYEMEGIGEMQMIRAPYVFEGSYAGIYLPPPAVGEHTIEVCSEILSIPDPEISRLIAEGVLLCGSNYGGERPDMEDERSV